MALVLDNSNTGSGYTLDDPQNIAVSGGNILSVGDSNAVRENETNVFIQVSDVPEVSTIKEVRFGGFSVPIVSWRLNSSNLIYVNVTGIDIKWGTSTTVEVVSDAGTASFVGVTVNPIQGWEFVTYTGNSPAPANASLVGWAATDSALGGSGHTSAQGDLVAITTTNGVVLSANGTLTGSGSGSYRIWKDTAGSSWTSIAPFTVVNGVITDLVAAVPFGDEVGKAVAYLRQATGVSSYCLNDLLVAYYRQVGSTSSYGYNDGQRAAQAAVPFVGQSPTDWRNNV